MRSSTAGPHGAVERKHQNVSAILTSLGFPYVDGKITPFYISAGEVRFSGANLQAYRLYRLFNFRRGPKLFILPGDVRRHVRLHAVNYRASF